MQFPVQCACELVKQSSTSYHLSRTLFLAKIIPSLNFVTALGVLQEYR